MIGALAMALLPSDAGSSDADHRADLEIRGAVLFSTVFTPGQGLGPLFNQASCNGCHAVPAAGGMGPEGLGPETRIGRLTSAGFDPMIGRGGPIARERSVAEEGLPCDLLPGIPAGANVTSVRNAPDLRGTGLIDAIQDEEIARGAVSRGGGIHGRAHWVRTADGRQRIGRFGWKADTATLRQFVANAFRNELGITSPLAPFDLAPAGQPGRHRCPGEGANLEDDGSMIEAVTAFVAALPPPVARISSPRGATLFGMIGCGSCHTASLSAGYRRAWLYSDLLVHDLGPDLDDRMVQGQAGGRDWRTTPLWGLGTRLRLLHDGRARTVTEAILAHGGEAAAARRRFRLLIPEQRDALLAFLSGL
jgi:CxxC motif-containing protein (DUF1111 family)